jgi:hypothetical protein
MQGTFERFTSQRPLANNLCSRWLRVPGQTCCGELIAKEHRLVPRKMIECNRLNSLIEDRKGSDLANRIRIDSSHQRNVLLTA